MERRREKLMAGEMEAPPESAEEKEAWIQEYARMLEDLKSSNPAEYERVVKQLQQQVKSGAGVSGGIKLPGGQNRVLGEHGVETDGVEREEVVPEPGFVIKTRDNGGGGGGGGGGQGDDGGDASISSNSSNISKKVGGGKVFINICTSAKLRKFKTVTKKLADGSVQEGLNIPLSCGQVKHEKDKQGAACRCGCGLAEHVWSH